jgi:hypothetical protein
MIQQGILPFKLEHTEELITPRSGLALFAEVVRTLRADQTVRESFARPGSNRGYEAWSYIEPLLLMLEGGGRHIEDLREIRDDETLRRLIGLRRMPSLSTFGDWIVRSGATGGVEAMRGISEEVAGRIWKRLATEGYTLDVDATVIEAEKQEAQWTYKKVRGWKPLFTEEGERTDREVDTAVHLLTKAQEPVRLVVQRWHDPQLELFEPNGYCYHVIASNRDELEADAPAYFGIAPKAWRSRHREHPCNCDSDPLRTSRTSSCLERTSWSSPWPLWIIWASVSSSPPRELGPWVGIHLTIRSPSFRQESSAKTQE